MVLGIFGAFLLLVLTVIFSFVENANMDKPKLTAKDFFLHSAILVTLYVSVISVITLLIQTINAAFPDVLDGYSYYYAQGYTGGMRFAVASLIIIFPVFIFLSWWNHREIERAPELKELAIKRWFSYLTLFFSGAAILTDLIVFLNSFLGGEISTRFILKVLVVLVVAAFIFVYHIIELRRVPVARSTYRAFSSLAALIVLGSIVWSFVVMGSPTTQRDYRLDERRVSDLQGVQNQVIEYWRAKEALPPTLQSLEDSLSGYRAPTDPVTQTAYEYRITGNLSFELCATFTRPSRGGREPYAVEYSVAPYSGFKGDNWDHEAGRTCFSRTIDPELYQPYSPPIDLPIRN